ncbi:shikimate dehydrogenase [Formicincola oecophyllae]|uniref:Shikimate dehydrogenase (NADP(+)) n=1 Tax=Formicincola oecophyllae TaxID=2558361 RepID=A0A4Y6U6F1_9PROT|nr:shikimate dehydrogenase [Formicincola oecophyllae]QDH12922.1 shikimate dehydrogenase [Formicincola oecophyllae]
MAKPFSINATTKLAGVMGGSVTHSRSPLLHQFWLRQLGVNGAYVPLPVAHPAGFEEAVRGLAQAGFQGANVTIPYKEAACALCDDLTPVARRAGAVNTLQFTRGDNGALRILGDSTDGEGFLASLERHGVWLRPGERVLVLGAGGAARAITAALLEQGLDVLVSNRTLERAQQLVAPVTRGGVGGGQVVPWDAWPGCLSGEGVRPVRVLVQATSLGMKPGAQPDWAGALAVAPANMVVADIVYTPLQTPLLQAALARGLKTVDGLGMLMEQAVPGFERWFGQRPEVDATTRALLLESLEGHRD